MRCMRMQSMYGDKQSFEYTFSNNYLNTGVSWRVNETFYEKENVA